VISRVEKDPRWLSRSPEAASSDGTFSDALIKSAVSMVRTMKAKCMVVVSESGSSVMRASRERPEVPILAIVPEVKTARWLNLQKNVYATVIDSKVGDSEKLFEKAIESAWEKHLLTSKDDIVIATAGLPYGTKGAANVIRVITGDAGKPPAFQKIA